MQKVLSAEEMREVDRLTTEKYGIPPIILMENAAHAAANVIKEKLGGSVAGKSFLILCGKGNNGGDGAALGRILWTLNFSVVVLLFGKIEDTKGDARTNFNILRNIDSGSLDFIEIDEDDFESTFHKVFYRRCGYNVVVDALFGTGLTRPLDEKFSYITKILSEKQKWKQTKNEYLLVSLDIPSGLNADSNEPIGENVHADLTVTFSSPKIANVVAPASSFNGELNVVDIGSHKFVRKTQSKIYIVEKSFVVGWLSKTKFTSNSYKNKRGHALLIAGSKNYAGAAVLCGNAAMVSGVGLVTIATSESARDSIASRVLPEIMTRGMAETSGGAIAEDAFNEIKEFIGKGIDAVAVGSGISSTEETTRHFVGKIVKERKTPVVIDADGLNALAPFDLEGSDELPLILTPHEGEFLRLLGTKDKEILKDRVKAVRDFAEKHKVILVLKGERALIAAPDGRVVINPTGNSGLGKAGNGDTLTGIITGFIAQTMQTEHFKTAFEFKTKTPIDVIFETVVAAVYIAGLAGDIAAEKYGKRAMLASDVRKCLSEAFRQLEN